MEYNNYRVTFNLVNGMCETTVKSRAIQEEIRKYLKSDIITIDGSPAIAVNVRNICSISAEQIKWDT